MVIAGSLASPPHRVVPETYPCDASHSNASHVRRGEDTPAVVPGRCGSEKVDAGYTSISLARYRTIICGLDLFLTADLYSGGERVRPLLKERFRR